MILETKGLGGTAVAYIYTGHKNDLINSDNLPVYYLDKDMLKKHTGDKKDKIVGDFSDGKVFEGSGDAMTAKMMQDYGWSVSSTELTKINDTLQKYGITDANSIRLFMATCAHESGMGAKTLEGLNKDGTTVGNYLPTERGAGYIQLTWRATHLQFLATIPDSFSNTDTATHIANNYPWEAAAWFWTSRSAKTIGTPPISINEYVQQYGDSKGVYFVTQYAVNGWFDSPSNAILSDIRDGKIVWNVKSGRVIVNGSDVGKAPNGWNDSSNVYNRENAYNGAIKYFQ